ncbi:dihydrofolate reductase [Candidatus Saccharibacteria bacterium]|nr:dihydrofolate reductase [Candidatus Saccharibacteria bacterium]
MFSIIAAIGKNNALGKDNDLIFHIKEDMDFFRKTTTGHKVVMGSKTWDSLPTKLKNRENIVISRHNIPEADKTVNNLEDYIAKNIDTQEEIFIIGGGSIYAQFLPYAKHLYLTEVDSEPEADVFFPEFDKRFYRRKKIKHGKQGELEYSIVKYTKK